MLGDVLQSSGDASHHAADDGERLGTESQGMEQTEVTEFGVEGRH